MVKIKNKNPLRYENQKALLFVSFSMANNKGTKPNQARYSRLKLGKERNKSREVSVERKNVLFFIGLMLKVLSEREFPLIQREWSRIILLGIISVSPR